MFSCGLSRTSFKFFRPFLLFPLARQTTDSIVEHGDLVRFRENVPSFLFIAVDNWSKTVDDAPPCNLYSVSTLFLAWSFGVLKFIGLVVEVDFELGLDLLGIFMEWVTGFSCERFT